MTELSLIFGITFVSLTFSGGLLRWISGLALGNLDQTRIYNAVARASEAYFWRVMRASLPTVVVLTPLLALALWLERRSTGGGVSVASWGVAGWLLGFVLTSGLAFLTIQVSVRVASRAVEAAREDASHAMGVLLRGTGICSLLADTLSIAVVAVLIATRTLPLGHAPSLELLKSAVEVLPSLGLGVAVAALVFHAAGSAFHSASEVASTASREDLNVLASDDERDPALIAALVGDHVGLVISRTVDAFFVGLLANIAAVIASFALLLRNPTVFADPLSFLALPLVLRAVGLLATGFGMMAARSDESQDPIAATWRGLLTTTTVTLSGLAGSCLWVLGNARWAGVFLASAIGLIACSLAAQLPRLLTRSTASYGADQREGWSIGKDLGVALQVVTAPVLVIAVSLALAYAFGEYTALVGGGVLGLVSALSGMCSISGYMLALNVASPLAANVKSVVSLPLGRLPQEAQRRASRVDNAAFSAASVAQTFFVFAGANAALLTGLSLLFFNDNTPQVISSAVSLEAPIVMWSGVLGAILVLSYAGSTITATSQGSLLTLREVRKQLTAATPAEHSDEPSTPNYRSMLEAATGSALERMTTLVLGAILIPTTIGIALRLYYGKNPGLAGEALLSLVTLASVTALAIGLLAHAARIVLERLRAAPKDTSTAERSASPAGVPALQFGTLAELVGNSAGPAAQIFVKALAIICLTLTPLII